ncbi:MAG TPA: hypothetical protein VEZ52_10395, partial [Desulfovibrio sp.]|uniref:hypothetical protein n=1 Tax=Desulfovibrio sp. TaxID=885 RepID=UPI002D65FD73
QRVELHARAGFAVGGQQLRPLLFECAHNASSPACTACAPVPQARAADAFLLFPALLGLQDVFKTDAPTGKPNRAARPDHDEFAF